MLYTEIDDYDMKTQATLFTCMSTRCSLLVLIIAMSTYYNFKVFNRMCRIILHKCMYIGSTEYLSDLPM